MLIRFINTHTSINMYDNKSPSVLLRLCTARAVAEIQTYTSDSYFDIGRARALDAIGDLLDVLDAPSWRSLVLRYQHAYNSVLSNNNGGTNNEQSACTVEFL